MGKGFKLPGVSPLKQEGDKFGLPSFDRSEYRSSGGSYSSPQDPSTYFTPGNYFAEGIGSFGNISSEYIKNKKPEVNPDGSIGNIGGARTSQTLATNLDKRIAAAEAKGDKSKTERLKGKKQRRSMRDTTKAEINKKKNKEIEAKLQERLNERLTKKGIDPSTVSTSQGSEYKKLFANMASNLGVQTDLDTSTDGTSAMNMKKESPLGFVPSQQMGQPQAFSYDVPQQANMMGTAQPVFNQQTMGMAEAAFGNQAMRQASVGSAFQVSAKQEAAFGPDSKLAKEDPAQAKKIYDGIKAGDNSPAASYENPQTVVDHSGGYVAAKALDTFGQLAGNFITKKYGQGETEVEQK